MNRRRFLKRAARAAAGTAAFPLVVPASALGKDGAVAPSNRIVVGCIGVGWQGMNNLRGFLRQPDVEVAAVCDVCRKSTDYFMGNVTAGLEPAREAVEDYCASRTTSGQYKGCSAYTDFRDLLLRRDIDAVTVCTPDHWHGVIGVAAARAGKDIYCEKPLANSVAEGRAICDAVSRYGRILQTGSHERSNDSVRLACELVRNGRIGELGAIRVNMPNDEPHHAQVRENCDPKPTMPVPAGFDYDRWLGRAPWAPYTKMRCHFWWRFILDYGGGEMTDRGAHIIDLAQFVNDADSTGPVELSATGKAPREGLFDTFMEYQFQCRYANGVRMIGESVAPRGIRFEGADGWIFVHIHGGRLEAEPESLLTERIGPNEIHVGRTRGDHRRDFLDAVRSRSQPVAPAEAGHRTATICHLLNIAMRTGQTLAWDPQAERITNVPELNRLLVPPMRGAWSA